MSKYHTIHLWSGPRSLSTATMYSFGQRNDTQIHDEPLYAHWLNENESIYRPYREKLIESSDCDSVSVIRKLNSSHTDEKPIVFGKHIAKQYTNLNSTKSVLFETKNENVKIHHVFLIRNPFDMIKSWDDRLEIHKEKCTLDSMSLPLLVQMYSLIRETTNKTPIVIDSSLLKTYPREVLSMLCYELGIPFQEEQLSWAKGPKSFDGLWAEHWYHSVHNSSGFNAETAAKESFVTFNQEQLSVYREALPFYELLLRSAIGVNMLCPNSSKIELYNPLMPKYGEFFDPKNADIMIWVGDKLYPREYAKVSVFDSAVQGGDAVWEGIRIYKNKIFKLQEHVNRLFDSAKALDFQNIPDKEFVFAAIFKTLAANGMRDGAHVRLTLTRGCKITSSMNPKFNVFGCNLLVVPEWKNVQNPTTYDNDKGISLITATTRRQGPATLDSKIHHCNLINNILAKIQANNSDAHDALMLDCEGFVAETNATNVFMVKDSVVHTPTADYCLPGVTRKTVIELLKQNGVPIVERKISLSEFHCADEIFTTGTMGELTPVISVDGRRVSNEKGPITSSLQRWYKELTLTMGVEIS